MEKSDYGTLKFGATSNVDRRWGESFPNDGFANIRSDEQVDSGTETVALSENCRLVQEQAEWVNQREVELKDEEARLEEMREELEEDIQRAEQKGNVSLNICVRPLTMINLVLSAQKQESFGGSQEYPSFGFT